MRCVNNFPICRHTQRSEEHTSELQSRPHLVCRLLLEKKKKRHSSSTHTYPINSLYVFFFHCYGTHRHLHSFPTRRSSDLPSQADSTAKCRESSVRPQ